MAAHPRAPPPELIGDAVAQILVRIPPDESAHLARASLVCKLWRRIISDPGFTRLYREFHHRTPPLLGFLHNTERGSLFFPTAAACPFPRSPCGRWRDLDYRRWWALDCRHGRVLFQDAADTRKLIVWDPIGGGQEELDKPHHFQHTMMCTAAKVLCAAAAGCDHVGCPFLVALVGIYGGSAHGCVYSSEARAWGEPAVSLHLGTAGRRILNLRRGALVGDDAYFIACDGDAILKYDLRRNRLSAINPPGRHGTNIILMPAGDDGASLGLAGIKDTKLHLWSRKQVDDEGTRRVAVARWWVQCRVVELERLLHVDCRRAMVIGFAEGVGVLFVRVDASTFMIELKSGQVSKVSDSGVFYSALPFMSFHASAAGFASSTVSASPLPAEGNILLESW
ncbi:hypothetical protein PVAP13_2KG023300 [Panicum virgatum]|uniref:F-box domain-containing protein n=1 Tax=Panicum virgatum TaxID=38727 RepID=A0A8T0W0X2_PANVG|nr:hypothetical protein PVAP13_2KG023300 [Panicum virgatum]